MRDHDRDFGPRVEEGETRARNNKRVRNQLMRQFIRSDGPGGNSRDYRLGWERIFGVEVNGD